VGTGTSVWVSFRVVGEGECTISLDGARVASINNTSPDLSSGSGYGPPTPYSNTSMSNGGHTLLLLPGPDTQIEFFEVTIGCVDTIYTPGATALIRTKFKVPDRSFSKTCKRRRDCWRSTWGSTVPDHHHFLSLPATQYGKACKFSRASEERQFGTGGEEERDGMKRRSRG
jgi:hypothetical protein